MTDTHYPLEDADRLDAIRHGRMTPVLSDDDMLKIAAEQKLTRDELTFTEYQARAALTSVAAARSLEYLLPGLAAEVGELCNVYAKATRDNGGTITNGDLIRIQKEAGDILWFVSELCRLEALPLDNVARANLAKLADRQARGTLRGSGDDR